MLDVTAITQELFCQSPLNFGPRLVLACAHLTDPRRWPNRCGDFKAVVPGGDRLLKPCRAALAFPECRARVAEVVLRHRPVERHALARPFLQCGAVGGDRLLEAR